MKAIIPLGLFLRPVEIVGEEDPPADFPFALNNFANPYPSHILLLAWGFYFELTRVLSTTISRA
jgi:hypothetical protein